MFGDARVDQALLARAAHFGHQLDDSDVHGSAVKIQYFRPTRPVGAAIDRRAGGKTPCADAMRSTVRPRACRRRSRAAPEEVRVRAALERGAGEVAARGAPAAERRRVIRRAALGPGAVVGERRGDRHEADHRAWRVGRREAFVPGGVRRRRYIVPANGFYSGSRSRGAAAFLRPPGPGASSSRWRGCGAVDAAGRWRGSSTPSRSSPLRPAAMRPLHDRMPVILAPGDWWFSG